MKRINPGMKACMADGGIIAVDDVLIDPHDGSERYLVLSVNGVFGQDAVAPISTVWRVDERVHLNLACGELAALPRFTPLTYCREQGLCSRAAALRGPGWHRRDSHTLHP